jgi:hypothetical protein
MHLKEPPDPQGGAVLFEVVLALVLFAAAAAIIGGGFKAAIESLDRQRLQAHAADLAVSIMSELQMGLRSLADPGPQEFDEPFAEWTWEITSTTIGETDADAPTQVEIIIRREEPPITLRLNGGIRVGARPALETTEPVTSTPEL